MTKQATFSNEEFWKWISGLIKNNVNYFDDMIDVERYATGREFRNNTENKCFIFQKLKDSVPSNYFHEMEYCALAYSVVFGKVFPPLAQHIEELAYIEWLNYVEPEDSDYRDHFVHMLKVTFVCDELFHKFWNDTMVKWQFDCVHFKRWCKEEKIYFHEDKKQTIMSSAVFLSAIFHDFGYGYNFLRTYEERLFKLNLVGCDSMDITKIRNKVINKSLLARFIIEHHEWYQCTKQDLEKESDERLKKIRRENIPCGFIHDCLPLNHSVASSLMVLDIAEDLYQSQIINTELYIAFQIAAEACLLHDLTKRKKYLHLSHVSEEHRHFLDYDCQLKTPIATLLIFADELSMWSRPLVEFTPKGDDKLEGCISYKWKYKHFPETTFPNKLKINFNDTSNDLEILLEREEQKNNLQHILSECNCFSGSNSKTLKMFESELKIGTLN